ncbi:MAG: hypothetical protein QOF83_1501 [Solirubrobacteraceae bacterium]|nr:hypothetical protein [Solirubrobacteraceae bacterium]
MAPKAIENRTATSEAPVKVRARNRSAEMRGLPARAQCTANSARAMPDRVRAVSVEPDPQPQSWPLTRPRVSAATPPVTSPAPSASGVRTGCPGTAGSRRQPATSATRPMGTLTRNTQRQLAATSTPPTTGPSAAARPPTAVQARTAPWRRSGAVVASTRLSEVGVSRAAPAAWRTRKMTSIVRLSAAPQAAEAAVNRPTPSRKPWSRRRLSASRPNSTRSEA